MHIRVNRTAHPQGMHAASWAFAISIHMDVPVGPLRHRGPVASGAGVVRRLRQRASQLPLGAPSLRGGTPRRQRLGGAYAADEVARAPGGRVDDLEAVPAAARQQRQPHIARVVRLQALMQV